MEVLVEVELKEVEREFEEAMVVGPNVEGLVMGRTLNETQDHEEHPQMKFIVPTCCGIQGKVYHLLSYDWSYLIVEFSIKVG